MRILVLKPFARGGVASYTDQAVAALRADGHTVTVAAPEGADHRLELRTRGAGLALVRLARSADLLLVQYQPEMFGPADAHPASRLRALARLAVALRAAPRAEVAVHEISRGAGLPAAVFRALLRVALAPVDGFTVFTEGEREALAAAVAVPPDRIRVVGQGDHLQRRTADDRDAARAHLRLVADATILVALGFLAPTKGFDRAIRAFAAADPPPSARLYVVGSLWRGGREHVAELQALAAGTPGAEVRETYLSDEDFDRWIVAADALVLPYRVGESSNVMERGVLYGRPVIMSRVGGMAAQAVARPDVQLVADDAELTAAVRRHLAP